MKAVVRRFGTYCHVECTLPVATCGNGCMNVLVLRSDGQLKAAEVVKVLGTHCLVKRRLPVATCGIA